MSDIKRFLGGGLIAAVLLACPIAAQAAEPALWETARIETDYVLSAGGVSDGTHLWTIPYEKGAFAKIDLKTGEAENLTHSPSFDKLKKLAGYRSGVLTEQGGRQYLLLVPYDIGRPIARVQLETLEVDFPLSDPGYYFGSCHIEAREGARYLWMVPETKKPLGTTTKTEIVKVNLDTWQKESAITCDVDGEYYGFSGSIVAENQLWLLPSESGQPLMCVDMAAETQSLGDAGVQKLYSSEAMRFAKLSAGVYDGTSLWFVGENPSFLFRESVLYRCDRAGNPTETRTLTKDHYSAMAADGEYLYLCAGAQGMQPKNMRISLASGSAEFFESAEKSGYLPAQVVPTGERGLYILPETKNRHKKPLLRILPLPETRIQKATEEKVYRDYGDEASGCPLSIEFQAPEGFYPAAVHWFVSGRPMAQGETQESFDFGYRGAAVEDRHRLPVKDRQKMSVLATKNGTYRFMTEYAAEGDEERRLYSFSQLAVDEIYERLPLTVRRYDLAQPGEGGLIEAVVYKEDFGAAFAYDARRFLATDTALEITPAAAVDGTTGEWQLAEGTESTLSFAALGATPQNYCASVDFHYQLARASVLREEEATPNAVLVANFSRTKNFGIAPSEGLAFTMGEGTELVDVAQKGAVIEIVVQPEQRTRSIGSGAMLVSAKKGWDENRPLEDPEQTAEATAAAEEAEANAE